MNRNIKNNIEDYIQANQRKGLRRKVAAALSLLIAVCVVLNLMEPASTMTAETHCGLAEHTHSAECYATRLVCGQEEGEGHSHTADCFEIVCVCGMNEHRHTAECFDEVAATGVEDATAAIEVEDIDEAVAEADDIDLDSIEEDLPVKADGEAVNAVTEISEEDTESLEAVIITEATECHAGQPVEIELGHFGGVEPVVYSVKVTQNDQSLFESVEAPWSVEFVPVALDEDSTVTVTFTATDAAGETDTRVLELPCAVVGADQDEEMDEPEGSVEESEGTQDAVAREETIVDEEAVEESAQENGEAIIEDELIVDQETITEDADNDDETTIDEIVEEAEPVEDEETAKDEETVEDGTAEEEAIEEEGTGEEEEAVNDEEAVEGEDDTEDEALSGEDAAQDEDERIEEGEAVEEDSDEQGAETEPQGGELSFESDDCAVRVTYGADAGIPEDAQLVVRAIEPGDELYSAYAWAALEAIKPAQDIEKAEEGDSDEKVTEESAAEIDEAEAAEEIEETDEENREASQAVAAWTLTDAKFITLAIEANGETVAPQGIIDAEVTYYNVAADEAAFLRIGDTIERIDCDGTAVYPAYAGEVLGWAIAAQEVTEAKTEPEGEAEPEEEPEEEAPEEETETDPEPVTLTWEGEDYTVTLTGGEDARIPEGAALEVSEVEADSEAYAALVEAALATLADDEAVEAVPEEADQEAETEETTEVGEADAEKQTEIDNIEDAEAVEEPETEQETATETRIEWALHAARFFTVGVVLDGEPADVQGDIKVAYSGEGKAAFFRMGETAQRVEGDGEAIFTDYSGETLGFGIPEETVMEVEPEEEPEAEPVFEAGVLNYAGADFAVALSYEADAEIPADAALEVREILLGTDEYALYAGQADAALSEDWNEAVARPRFFDITILLEGEELQPAAPVSVQITFDEAVSVPEDADSAVEDVKAIHFADDGAQVLAAESEQPEEAAGEAVSFDAESFSVYGIVPTATITRKVITAEGETFEISVTYGKEAEIPEGAKLLVDEITAGSDPEIYEQYTALSAAALTGDPEATLALARLFDISIVDAEGGKVEPQSAVQVKIGFAAAEQDNGEEIKVVHFADEGTELLDAEKNDAVKPDKDQVTESQLETVTFETGSFSVFEVVQPDIVLKDKPLEDGWYRIVLRNDNSKKWGNTIDVNQDYRIVARLQNEDGAAWYVQSNDINNPDEYILSTKVEGETKYLKLTGETNQNMDFTSNESEASVVKISEYNNGYQIMGKVKNWFVRMNNGKNLVIFTGSQNDNGSFIFEPVEYIGDGYYTIQTACTGNNAGTPVTGKFLQKDYYKDNADNGTMNCLTFGDTAQEWHFEHVPGDDTGSQFYVSYSTYTITPSTDPETGYTTENRTNEVRKYIKLELGDGSNGHFDFTDNKAEATPVTLVKQGNNYRMSYGGSWIRLGADCNRVMCSNDNNDAGREEWSLTLVSADPKSQSRADVQHPTETYTIVSYLETASDTATDSSDTREWHPSMNAVDPDQGHISPTDVVVFTNTAGTGRLAVDSTVQPASEWQFEAHGAGFYIYTRVQGAKKYLRFSPNDADTDIKDATLKNPKYASLVLDELPTMLLKTPVAGMDGVYQITDEHGRYKLFLHEGEVDGTTYKGYFGTDVTTADVLPSTYFYLLEQVVGAPSGSLGGGEEGAIHNDTQYAILARTGDGDNMTFYAMTKEGNDAALTIGSRAASIDGYTTSADVTQWRFKKVQAKLPYDEGKEYDDRGEDQYYNPNQVQYYLCFGKDEDLHFLKLDSERASITNQANRQPLRVEKDTNETDGVERYRIYSVDGETQYSLFYDTGTNGFKTTTDKQQDNTYLRLCSVVANDAWPMAGQKFVIRTLEGKKEGEDEIYYYLDLPAAPDKDGQAVRGVAYSANATPTEWAFDKNIYSEGAYQIKIGDLWLLDNGNNGFTEESDGGIYAEAIANGEKSHETTKTGGYYEAALVCDDFALRNTTWYFDKDDHLISGGTYYDSNGTLDGWDWPAQKGTTGGRRLAVNPANGKVYILNEKDNTPSGWFDTFTTEKLPDKVIGDVDQTSKYAIVFVPSRYWKVDSNPSDQIHSLAMLNTAHPTRTGFLGSMLTYVTKKDHETGTQYVFSTTGSSKDYVGNISSPQTHNADEICWQFVQAPGNSGTGIDGFAYYLKTKTSNGYEYVKANDYGTLGYVDDPAYATEFVLQIDNSIVPPIGYQPYLIKAAGTSRYLETDDAEAVMGGINGGTNNNVDNKTATDAILDGIQQKTGFHLVDKGTGKPGDNNRFLLARYLEELEDSHTKVKVSVCDLEDGQKTMIYRRWLDADNVEHFFAVLTDGSLREVYDGGDTVGWRENWASGENDSQYLWTFNKTATGDYYTFTNNEGQYLLPQSGYRLVYADGEVEKTGVTLDGRNRGEYGSSIVGWDYNTNTNYYLALNNSGNGFYPQAVAEGFKFSDADEFFFAQDISEKQYSIPVAMINKLTPTNEGQDDKKGTPVLIYVRDSEDNVYAVGGDGSLLPVEEYSGYIIWKEAELSGKDGYNPTGISSNYLWTFDEKTDNDNETAHYDYAIKNTKTGNYLLPQANGFIFAENDLPKMDNDQTYNALSLQTNERTTPYWAINSITAKLVANNYDGPNNWTAYTLVLDESGGRPVLKSVLSETTTTDVVELGFAQYPTAPNDLNPVETVDNVAMNITIKMFDYMPGQKADSSGYWHYKEPQNSVQSDNDHIGNTNGGTYGYPLTGLVKNVLGTDGYPVVASNGKSLADLFNGEPTENKIVPKGDANYLFLKSIYESTGYLEYSSFDNYAYFREDVTLADGSHPYIVYDDVGSPYWTNTGANQELSYYLSRGNFMPFNKLEDATRVYNYYLHDPDGSPLHLTDPSFGEPVYVIENPNYLNGMTMEATFYQTKDGKSFRNPGEDVIFEFNGDDDMWVFVDGVQLLDMGGIHDAHTGWINFATGEIYYEGQEEHYATLPRTIKAAFKAASRLPDGSEWDESKVSQFFRGETFVDYTSHDFKMFYMERGAGASNLHLRFNLETVPKGAVSIKKELTKDENVSLQEAYGNITYDYKLYIKNTLNESGAVENKYMGQDYIGENFFVLKPVSGTYLTQVVDGKTQHYATVSGKDDNGKEYKRNLEFDDNGIFHLKAGETAQFDGIPSSYEYYVEEVGVSSEVYDVGFAPSGMNNSINSASGSNVSDIYKIDENVSMISVNNTLKKTSKLTITKDVVDALFGDYAVARPNKGFSFYVYFEDHNGKMVPFANGRYYITKMVDGAKHYYHYGSTDTGDSLTDYGRIVARTSEYVPSEKYTKAVGAKVREDAENNAGNNGAIDGIPAGYSIEIEGLMPGTHFIVTENQVNAEYALSSFVVNGADTYMLDGQNATLYPDGLKNQGAVAIPEPCAKGRIKEDASDINATATNVAARAAEITLTKIDGTTSGAQNPTKLANAEFQLCYKTASGMFVPITEVKNGETVAKTYTTDSQGVLTISGLPVDQTYMLKETKAPDGYNLPSSGLVFTISAEGTVPKKDEADAETWSGPDTTSVKYVLQKRGNDWVRTALQSSETAHSGDIELTSYGLSVTVPNNPGVRLPNTGGSGTALYTLLGSLLLIGAALGLIKRYSGEH